MGRVVVTALFLVFAARTLFAPTGNDRVTEKAGTFPGAPVAVATAARSDSQTGAQVVLDLQSGHCDVAEVSESGSLRRLFRARKIDWKNDAFSGRELRLVPSPDASGEYYVAIGDTWDLTRSGLRPIVGTLVAVSAVLIWLPIWLGPTYQRRVAIALASIFSGLIVYPVIHEGGHAIFGVALGGAVQEIVWTPFEGRAPHVTFRSLPQGSGPWMTIGGIALPTVVGLLLALIWMRLRQDAAWWKHLALLAPGATLLFGNMGTLIGGDHTRPLVRQLGFSGIAGQFLEITPAILSLLILIPLGLRLRRILFQTGPTGEDRALRTAQEGV